MSGGREHGLLESIVSARRCRTTHGCPAQAPDSINEAAKVSAHAPSSGGRRDDAAAVLSTRALRRSGAVPSSRRWCSGSATPGCASISIKSPPVSAVPITHKLVRALDEGVSEADRRNAGFVGPTGSYQEHDRRIRQGRRDSFGATRILDRQLKVGRRGLPSAPRPTSIPASPPRPKKYATARGREAGSAGSRKCEASCMATSGSRR